MIIKNSSLSFETSISSNQELTFDYISKALEENKINIQVLINKEKTTTSTILNKLVENGVLVKIGNGPSTRYEMNR